ncbi:MAG: GGDEF domain-containing protein [Candidatus Melainabacteria bacterium]|nr:GGDEF domain-containing protein [Candidatus Melainabacteria bacterium]
MSSTCGLSEWFLLPDGSRLKAIIEELSKVRPSIVSKEADSQNLEQVHLVEQAATAPGGEVQLRAVQGEEMERLAFIDPLTEIYNTKAFFKELKDALKRSRRYHRPLAVALLNIDGHKAIVSEHGRLTGDTVLKIASSVVRSIISEMDLPARYDEERLAIIFPESNAAEAALVCERIRQRMGIQAVSYNWHNLKISASIGVACFPQHAQEYDSLVAKAEQALKVAIERGGDRVCVV